MTGENFIRIERGSEIKEIKEKINSLRNKCGDLINNIIENGFDEEKYNNLCKEIEWQEYLLWGVRNNMVPIN